MAAKAHARRRLARNQEALVLSKQMSNERAPCTGKNASTVNSHWSFNLINAMKDPRNILQEDELTVVLLNKYPKATYHFLVLPKQDILAISLVGKQDLPLLRHMQEVAHELTHQFKEHNFLYDGFSRIGYHAVPSLYRLHLHVISDDFCSPSLKSLKHWNSFTKPCFLPSRDVIKELEETGQLQIDVKVHEAYLKSEPRCHKCSYCPKNMLDLKNHILQHRI